MVGPALRRAAHAAGAWLARDVRRFTSHLRGTWGGAASAPRGLYSYRLRPPGGERRVQLRIEADGRGELFVDASHVIHLSETAAAMTKLALDDLPRPQAVERLRACYGGVTREALAAEYGEVARMVAELAEGTGRCPTGALGVATVPVFSHEPEAPYKADLALTYGCNNACGHCYNEPGRKAMASLSAGEWRQVLDRLADVGVPHVVFTGGEPTTVPELPDLIRHADRLGLVAGLNTNGRLLARDGCALRLKEAGLSHVQVTLESDDPAIHNAMTGADSFAETTGGILAALGADLHTVTNTTLTTRNCAGAESIVGFAASLGVRTAACNALIRSGKGRSNPDALDDDTLREALTRLRECADARDVTLLWYTPTEYCRLSPIELDLTPRRCNAGEYSVCVEPNGDVLPCQSYYEPVGHILRDPWSGIWDSALFRSFRERRTDPARAGLPERCWECEQLAVCGGGCRLERDESVAAPFRPEVGRVMGAPPKRPSAGVRRPPPAESPRLPGGESR